MFSIDTQKAVANLHITYRAGKKASAITSNSKSIISKLKANTVDGLSELCPDIASHHQSEIENTIGLIQYKTEQDTKLLNLIAEEEMGEEYAWEYDAVDIAKKYESIIDKAVAAGEEIFDACLVVENKRYNEAVLSDAVTCALELQDKGSMSLKVVCEGSRFDDDTGVVYIYTTTSKLAELVAGIKKSDNYHWENTSLESYIYARSLTETKSINELIEGGFERRYHAACALNSGSLTQIGARGVYNEKSHFEAVGRIFSKSGNTHVNGEMSNYRFADSEDTYHSFDLVVDNADKYGINEKVIKLVS
ncbi:hypothetical protein VCHA53O466_320012 [Vibrio chagasii]|nr:hypothetical protein VCHA53O466_320012 [Vibrio chagasii]